MRILVVEDERLLCDGIAEDLRLEKYTVDCCYDGPAACERLFVEPYDLVVLDPGHSSQTRWQGWIWARTIT